MGGKFWRINYPEEKVRGKDGAKPASYAWHAFAWNVLTSRKWSFDIRHLAYFTLQGPRKWVGGVGKSPHPGFRELKV